MLNTVGRMMRAEFSPENQNTGLKDAKNCIEVRGSAVFGNELVGLSLTHIYTVILFTVSIKKI